MSHPSSGAPNPAYPGQYPPPGPYPQAQPPSGQVPPGYSAPGQYPPQGHGPGYPPGPTPGWGPYPPGPGGPYPPGPGGPYPPGPGGPYPAGRPGYPGGIAPKKRKGGAWNTVFAVFGVLILLVCVGGGGYIGWLGPKLERDGNERVFESLGVPEGFTVTEPAFVGDSGRLEVHYYLLCEKRVCPVNPAEKIHKWLTENKMTNMTIQDVQKCLADSADDSKAVLCLFEWEVDGRHVSVHAMWATTGDKPEDRRWLLDTNINS